MSGRRATPIENRLLARIQKTEGCWFYTGSRSGNGYGQINEGKKNRLAHRVSYELHCGPVLPGLVLDHICRVRHCVRPEHLRAVTAAENNRVSDSPSARNARKTHCWAGHLFTAANTYTSRRGSRNCRACHLARWHARKGQTHGPS